VRQQAVQGVAELGFRDVELLGDAPVSPCASSNPVRPWDQHPPHAPGRLSFDGLVLDDGHAVDLEFPQVAATSVTTMPNSRCEFEVFPDGGLEAFPETGASGPAEADS